MMPKTMILKALAALAFLSPAAGVVAQTAPAIGSDTLLRWLSTRDERDGSLAVGYIGGVRELTYQKEHCASAEVKLPELVGAVRQTIEAIPQPSRVNGSVSVIAALKVRWPCAGKPAASAMQTPQRATPSASPSPGGDASKLANWRALRRGMTGDDVRALLGEPVRIQGGGFTYWFWDRGGKVSFWQEKVDGWEEPR